MHKDGLVVVVMPDYVAYGNTARTADDWKGREVDFDTSFRADGMDSGVGAAGGTDSCANPRGVPVGTLM